MICRACGNPNAAYYHHNPPPKIEQAVIDAWPAKNGGWTIEMSAADQMRGDILARLPGWCSHCGLRLGDVSRGTSSCA